MLAIGDGDFTYLRGSQLFLPGAPSIVSVGFESKKNKLPIFAAALSFFSLMFFFLQASALFLFLVA